MGLLMRAFTILSGMSCVAYGVWCVLAFGPMHVVAGALCAGYGARVILNYSERG